ncbi:MAG TPA: IclR family transcriptional regulator, partial [Acidimicrobiaceae bacterium]|nr:IclR family transcriptional regulator [Acidimicrobiaceae bacterium]
MSTVQSIERAFAVLRSLAGGPAGVTEIADRVGLPKSTVARLLATLAEIGAVEQLGAGSQYRIGAAMAELAAAARPGRS